MAAALGYSNTKDAVARHIDPEDKRGSSFTTPSGAQNMTIINESGLYSLVLSSKLPSAKHFDKVPNQYRSSDDALKWGLVDIEGKKQGDGGNDSLPPSIGSNFTTEPGGKIPPPYLKLQGRSKTGHPYLTLQGVDTSDHSCRCRSEHHPESGLRSGILF